MTHVSDFCTTFTGDEQIQAFAGLSIRGQLKLIKVGMKSRHTRAQLFAAVTRHTGRAYTTRQLDLAIADLSAKYRIIV